MKIAEFFVCLFGGALLGYFIATGLCELLLFLGVIGK
jgi:hypothetical protein